MLRQNLASYFPAASAPSAESQSSSAPEVSEKAVDFCFFYFFVFPPNVSIGDILIKHPLRAHESHSQIKIPSTDHSP
jgi:hypothetical protein